MIQPGATLGLLGGGQLGRMFTIAARTMGYRVVVHDPDPHSPAGAIADRHLCAPYLDSAALTELAGEAAVVTTERERPSGGPATVAWHGLVRPSAAAVMTTQDRFPSSGSRLGRHRHGAICRGRTPAEARGVAGDRGAHTPCAAGIRRRACSGHCSTRPRPPSGGRPCWSGGSTHLEVSVVVARGDDGNVVFSGGERPRGRDFDTTVAARSRPIPPVMPPRSRSRWRNGLNTSGY
jgi:hypothetical protein